MPLIKPLLEHDYPVAVRGEGVYLYDSEGRRYLDGCSGAVTASLGHGLDEIVEALTEQAARVAFTYRGQLTNEPAEALADELAREAPGDLNWVFFVNSGSEAMETAQKIAVQYWRELGLPNKTIILSRSLGYHGITLGALAMSGHLMRRRLFAPLLHGFPIVAPPYCYRCPLGREYPDCNLACVDDFEEKLLSLGPEHVAAFAVEPVIGAAGGAIPAPDEYFARVREICDRHHILLIADEVMTGSGRTGYMHSLDAWGVQADLVALGKGLSAGYASIAATVVSDRLVEAIRAGSGAIMSGHTFSGNPLACAAGLAVLDYMREHKLPERARRLAVPLEEGLREIQNNHHSVGDVRGMGLLWGIEFVSDRITRTPFSPHRNVTSRVVAEAERRGLLVYPALSGADSRPGDAVIIAPPLTITESELQELLELLAAAIDSVEEGLEADIYYVHEGEDVA